MTQCCRAPAKEMSKSKASTDASLQNLRLISNRSNPLCPYIKDEECFQRLAGPQTQENDWVKRAAEEKDRSFLDSDPEIASQLMHPKPKLQHSLKHKLRDHVHDLFSSLASLDENQPKESVTKATYKFGPHMKRELDLVEKDNRKLSNPHTKWAEQCARAKQLGMTK